MSVANLAADTDLTSADLISIEEFLEMDLPDSCEWELVDGTVVSLTFCGIEHTLIQRNVYSLVAPVFLGRASVYVELSYGLGNFRGHRADVGVVSLERERAIPRRGILFGSPELVVEVLSPANRKRPYRPEDLERLCIEDATQAFWQVDADVRSVRVATAASAQTYAPGEFIPVRMLGVETEIAVESVFADLP